MTGPDRTSRARRVKSENKDRYGRLLRYVRNPSGRDLGTVLIRRGLAVARYDARDGYG
jgi:endonuclease YncB( thermonuclease family)